MVVEIGRVAFYTARNSLDGGLLSSARCQDNVEEAVWSCLLAFGCMYDVVLPPNGIIPVGHAYFWLPGDGYSEACSEACSQNFPGTSSANTKKLLELNLQCVCMSSTCSLGLDSSDFCLKCLIECEHLR